MLEREKDDNLQKPSFFSLLILLKKSFASAAILQIVSCKKKEMW